MKFVNLSFHWSLKKKLFGLFTLFAVLPVLCIAVMLTLVVKQNLDNMVHEDVEQTGSIVEQYLVRQIEEINSIAKRYSSNQEILSFFINKDRVRMEWKVKPIYSALKDEKDIRFFEYVDENGTVFIKGQEPGRHGEDYSENASIQLALDGKTASGLELINGTYTIVSYEPVISYEKVIGVLRIGSVIDEAFLKDMQSMISSDIEFFHENNLLLSSTSENSNQTSIDEKKWKKLSQTLALGKATFEMKTDGTVNIFYPITTIDQNTVQGFIRIRRDLSNIINIQHSIYIISTIIVLLSLGITVILSNLLSKNITNPIRELIQFMTKISQGDLSSKINVTNRHDEIGELTNHSLEMATQLKQIIQQIQEMTKQVVNSSNLLFSNAQQTTEALGLTIQSIDEIAKGAYQQMRGSEDTTKSLEEMAIGIQKIAENTSIVSNNSTTMYNKAQIGNTSVQKAITQIRSIDQSVQELSSFVVDLNQQSSEIENIVGVITNIANQTNLLALNAAIEAARAGEHGKGFAVVADEVRKLSVQVNDSIQQIASLIKSIQADANGSVDAMTEVTNEVKLGIHLIEDAGEAFQIILEASKYTSDQILEVSTASQEMSATSEEVTAAMEQISHIATGSSATSKQVAVSSQEQIESLIEIKESAKGLNDLVDQLEHIMERFTI